ncbi:MAG: DUF302 domain-containing protein [Bacteroidales bacterium]|jgi:uncharacterized protein (DUF302 family)|nr:DUF302 domain-containing protein [Bacteroidales bacterium]
MMEQLFLESKSRYSFEETVSKLNGIILEGGWKILHQHDLQEIMKKNGKDILSVHVIELCNPAYAYRLLSDDELRIYSNMLPCRISVYNKTDGNTYLSRLNPSMIAAQAGGVVQEVMSAAYNDAEQFIEKLKES